MKIENIFPTIQSFKELCDIAEKASPHLSFWGAKYITIQGYEGSLPLDSLTERVLELAEKNLEFDETERGFGKRTTKCINDIYDKSNLQVKNANILTWIIVKIRELTRVLTLDFITPRYRWFVYEDEYIFDYYTINQFQNVFHCTPQEAEKRGYQLGGIISAGDPDRWSIIKTPGLLA